MYVRTNFLKFLIECKNFTWKPLLAIYKSNKTRSEQTPPEKKQRRRQGIVFHLSSKIRGLHRGFPLLPGNDINAGKLPGICIHLFRTRRHGNSEPWRYSLSHCWSRSSQLFTHVQRLRSTPRSTTTSTWTKSSRMIGWCATMLTVFWRRATVVLMEQNSKVSYKFWFIQKNCFIKWTKERSRRLQITHFYWSLWVL